MTFFMFNAEKMAIDLEGVDNRIKKFSKSKCFTIRSIYRSGKDVVKDMFGVTPVFSDINICESKFRKWGGIKTRDTEEFFNIVWVRLGDVIFAEYDYTSEDGYSSHTKEVLFTRERAIELGLLGN